VQNQTFVCARDTVKDIAPGGKLSEVHSIREPNSSLKWADWPLTRYQKVNAPNDKDGFSES
jgi:hypothetical protein